MEIKDENNVKNKIEDKVFSYMEKHHMIMPGDNVIVGCSGGADSVCLLFLLEEFSKKTPLQLQVVHVNHCIRADAEEDARYVEDLCREKRIAFSLTVASVREFAAREKCSEEDAGRRVRYEAFRRAAAESGGAKIAVAHNRNDNAETMLLHLFRGSGLSGLCGIAPMRDGIVRPILCLERQEVEAYLRACGVGWCTDSTNEEDDYCRNRIRHHVIPYVESEVAQGVVAHMSRTAELLSDTDAYMERQTQEAIERCASCEIRAEKGAGRYAVDVERFLELHRALQMRALLALVKTLSPTGKDISALHVENLMSLFEKQGNREIGLPFGIRARRRYGTVILEIEHHRKKEGPDWMVKLPVMELHQPVNVRLPGGGSLKFCKRFYDKEQEVPRNQYTKWLDYDKMIESIEIRFRRTGDYLTIADGNGGQVHKSLKDYMITEKIPRELRERIPVLAIGSHVLWLVGYRISEYFKVDGNTNYILQVELKE